MNDIAILIPTYKRAGRLVKVYDNAKNSSSLINNVYFIAENDDKSSIDILEKNRFPYFINERSRNYAGALNTAYLKTKEKYFFGGEDDLDFKPGWLEKCLEKMVDPIKVVGVNGLHNKNVLRGIYANNYLVDRDYIEKYSGVFDAENSVLSEVYLHNFGDREFIETAKLRGVFAPCLEAIVEHLHWRWGLSPKDETYKLQDNIGEHDVLLYHKRKSLWTKKLQRDASK